MILAVAGQVSLKYGVSLAAKDGIHHLWPLTPILRMLLSRFVLIGLALYAISAVSWLVVLSNVDLSYAYPFMGLTYVLMMFVTKYTFGEVIPVWRWIGAFVIFVGVVISAVR